MIFRSLKIKSSLPLKQIKVLIDLIKIKINANLLFLTTAFGQKCNNCTLTLLRKLRLGFWKKLKLKLGDTFPLFDGLVANKFTWKISAKSWNMK